MATNQLRYHAEHTLVAVLIVATSDFLAMITVDLSDERASSRTTEQYLPGLRSFLTRACHAVSIAAPVAVLLTSDAEIRRLNRTFRGKNRATDVLSFPALLTPEQIAAPLRTARAQRLQQPAMAGDLAISLDTAERQAKQFGHPLQVELKILLLHGLLHLAGFDHETDAGEMAAREDQLRRRFRLPCTLIARAPSKAAVGRLPRSGARR